MGYHPIPNYLHLVMRITTLIQTQMLMNSFKKMGCQETLKLLLDMRITPSTNTEVDVGEVANEKDLELLNHLNSDSEYDVP
jgi:hypothetical protein